MLTPDVDDALRIRQSLRRQLPLLGALVAVVGAYLLLGATDAMSRWITWFGVAVFGSVVVVGLVGVLRGRRLPWELRLAADGVTVRGAEPQPWSAVAEVRVTGLRPGWFFLVPLGFRVIAFVPEPGAAMPALPSARLGHWTERWAAARRDRWYGSQLLLMPYAYDATTEQVLAAVRRFSDVPVREA